ncbi:protein-glutamine glutaminase family protein (plasmid) [Embleya sp. NBC_00888]|uniref:protein-glutamine glutaminase family protein n=1 Tax=Embleya sp. NBC_00888 TaxID=2975960 RepID=UPI002F917DE2|nr:protein-glutamine glutaminase family protein [Embleya sp. NBC_00888]
MKRGDELGKPTGESIEPAAKRQRVVGPRDVGAPAGPRVSGYEADDEYSSGDDEPDSGSSGEEGDGEDGQPSRAQIARIVGLDLAGIATAIGQEDEGFGETTPLLTALEQRRDALECVGDGAWIRSPGCATVVLTWLGTQATLVPDLVRTVGNIRVALATPASPAPGADERATMWTALCLALRAPERVARDGCEYLAHAICTWLHENRPDWARLHLVKYWLVASGGGLHPTYHWNHHVAPVLTCADGEFVLDPFLSPGAPMPLATWLAAVKGDRPPRLFERRQAWELIGAPVHATMPFDPGTRLVESDTILREVAACRR